MSPQEMTRRKDILYFVWVVLSVFVVVVGGTVFTKCRAEKTTVKEKYDELEYVVLHRPHITYMVDLRYMLCWATRKPDYQDLMQFECPERLLKEVEATVQRRAATRALKKNANKKDKKETEKGDDS